MALFAFQLVNINAWADTPAEHFSFDLAKITTDIYKGDFFIRAETDEDHNLSSASFIKPDGTVPIPFEGLKEGIILAERDGFKIIRLVSKDFDSKHGGHLTIDYLFNGLTNTRKLFEMDLTRERNDWVLSVSDQTGHHVFSSMFIEGNRSFGQVVGIKKITIK